MMRAGSIVYICREPHCTTEIAFHRDDHLPKSDTWICPACQDALDEQQMNHWARQHDMTMTPMSYPDRLRRMADF